MRDTFFFRCLPVILAMVSFLLGGCLGKSPSSRFYALTPMTAEQGAPGHGSPARNAVIGIGPIKLADYLDQPKIVTRKGDHQLIRAEYDQWAGSFKDNITSVLSENIGFLLPTERVYLYPWRRSVPVDYQVVLDIVRCDGRLGKDALLVARWSVFDGQDKTLVGANRSSIREPVNAGGYAAVVAAQSRALAKLSREIVQAIHAGRPGRQPDK
jgi:uncharacterized lipoprotein YmbA